MFSKITLLPYFMVPLILALLFKRAKKKLYLTYLISILFFLIYPFFILEIDYNLNPPNEEGQCAMFLEAIFSFSLVHSFYSLFLISYLTKNNHKFPLSFNLKKIIFHFIFFLLLPLMFLNEKHIANKLPSFTGSSRPSSRPLGV